MELKKEIESQMVLFNKQFYKKNKQYSVTATMNGEIIKVTTTDKEIIEFCKKLGLTE